MVKELSRKELWFRRSIKLVLLAICIFVIWAWWPKKLLMVRCVPVLKGTVESVVQSIQGGEVKSRHQAILRPSTTGKVEKINVVRGQRVSAGQLLIALDSASLNARIKLAKANLQAGMIAYRTAELRLKTAETSLRRNSRLAAKGVLAAGTLEKFQAEFDLAKEAVAASEAKLSQLRASLELAQTAYSDTRIKAPFDGIVVEVSVEIGETVSPATALCEIVDDSTVIIEAAVDEADAGRLKIGMDVRVETDAYPNKPFHGKLSYISPVVEKDLRQNRSLNVEISLQEGADKFKVGMSADIEVVVSRRDDVLWIPTSSVLRRGEKKQVYVLSGGFAKLRTIRCGLTNWERTEVTEGLHQGELVIVTLDAPGLADGVAVKTQQTGLSKAVAY